jgi:hypothetical protein
MLSPDLTSLLNSTISWSLGAKPGTSIAVLGELGALSFWATILSALATALIAIITGIQFLCGRKQAKISSDIMNRVEKRLDLELRLQILQDAPRIHVTVLPTMRSDSVSPREIIIRTYLNNPLVDMRARTSHGKLAIGGIDQGSEEILLPTIVPGPGSSMTAPLHLHVHQTQGNDLIEVLIVGRTRLAKYTFVVGLNRTDQNVRSSFLLAPRDTEYIDPRFLP